jgi:hypothetical protein
LCLNRYIELTASSYDEAKKTITNDAYLNGKRFAGENEDEDRNRDKQNNGRKNRSRSKQRSRSIKSRDRQFRSIKHRHSSSNSPRSHSHLQSNNTTQRSRNDNRRRSRSRSPVRRSSPPSANRNGEYLIKMRGMPYTVVEDDIRKFFPSTCQPVRIEIQQNRRTNRPNGDGHVYFKSMDEINEAMKFDRKYMGNRYVELYFDSPRLSTSSSNVRRSKSNDSTHRSPSKPTNDDDDDDDDHNNNKSRSRSESEH